MCFKQDSERETVYDNMACWWLKNISFRQKGSRRHH